MKMRRRIAFWKRIFLFIINGLLAVGCATTPAGPAIQYPPDLPAKSLVSGVPFYAQKKHQCGPAALAMVLQWSGREAKPEQLVPMVYAPQRKGSLQSGLVTAARRHGRLAYPINSFEALLEEVASGRPVIVLQNLGLKWIPRWHYAVIIGFDLDRHHIIMHSGVSSSRTVGFRTFKNTWRRARYWGLLVLPADQMPRNPDRTAYLKSALGLQIAGRLAPAVEAFENAASSWPHSAEAAVALGNAHYLNGSTHNALKAFSRAVQIDPDNGAALNNLAHLLAEGGELERAESVALRAVDAGGPHAAVYRQTLEEIRSKLGRDH